MAIDIFTCLRKIYEQNMNFGTYLILRGLIFGGAHIRMKFVLVSRGAYIQGLIIGGLIFGILRYDWPGLNRLD